MMLLKVLGGLVVSLGLLFAAPTEAPKEKAADAKDCCSAKMACCKAGTACCAAPEKLGCCASGKKCCDKDAGCCHAVQECCKKGDKCCDEVKPCCGTKAKKSVKE